MSKILIFTNHSYMLWQFRRELIGALQESNDVILCMPFVGHENDFKKMGLRCIETAIDRRGINPVTDAKLMRLYRSILRAEKPDKVITYSIKPNIYVGYLCEKMHIPYYANVQGLGTAFQKRGLAEVVTQMYKTAFRGVEKVFFENESNAEEFRDRRILEREKQVILHGAGVNLDYYAYQEYPSNAPMHFLYLGRIMREKGMDELFSAVDRLRADGESFVLDLVGFFEDEYREQIDRMVQDGIAVFHGFQEDPRSFYQNADCVVLPSYHEGMSNVLLEASATGRPVITSDIPGCRESVADRETGLLVPAKDAESLYGAMKEMLQMTHADRARMGKRARTKMEAEFDKKQIVQQTLQELV